MDIVTIIALGKTVAEGLSASTGALKNLKDAVGRGSGDSTELRDKLLDLYNQVLDAKMNQAALMDQVLEFQRQLEAVDRFEQEAKRYALVEAVPGTTLYRLKDTDRNGEPDHYLCTHCFGEGKKSIVQRSRNSYFVHCPRCSAEFRVWSPDDTHGPGLTRDDSAGFF